jgi:hypothetical protein
MKKLATAIATTALLATPAFAAMMRAPTKEPGETLFSDVCLTDEQSRKIRKTLADVHVDADAVMVTTGLGEWPLLEGLPFIAGDCEFAARLRLVAGPPWQAAKTFSDTIELCNGLLVRLDDPWNYNRVDSGSHDLRFPHLSIVAGRARAGLKALAAELERCRATLMATSGRIGARDVHIRFWTELRQVWRANVRKGTNKRLAKFVIACSEPFFPEETTDTAVSAFIERKR